MKLAIVGLSSVLLLTGCGSSPSLEDQLKLVEFDNCVEHFMSEKVGDSFTPYENYLKACEKYRP